MRELTNHIVPGDSANHQLKIEVIDEPGQGGACHRYDVTGFDTTHNPSNVREGYVASFDRSIVLFQNGPIKEVGVNGVTHEALLAVLIDRLRSFQEGPYACDDNADALRAMKQALHILQKRTMKRIARGVEGTHEK